MIKLRGMESEDKNLLIRYLNNQDVVRFLSSKIPQPYTDQDAEWWVEVGSKQGGTVRAIEYHGLFCGVIGAVRQHFEYSHCAEIGYWLGREYWGKGIATEAVIKLTQLVFADSKLQRLYAPVFSANKASMRVLEKAGYKLEGIFEKAICKNGEYFNEHRFVKLRS
jgi:ribosomal-protein-alanine N-acetyltransferase